MHATTWPDNITARLLFMLVLLTLAALSGCKTLQMASDWAAQPKTADGASSDWVLASGSTINEENLQVSASSDSANLHLMVRFRANDMKWSQACAMTGLTVWLNPAGRKSRNTGLRFAAGPAREKMPVPEGMPARPDMAELSRGPGRMLADGRLHPVGRKAPLTGPIVPDGSAGPSAGFVSESGICTYEFCLPFAATDAGRFAVGAKPGATIVVGLTAGMGEAGHHSTGKRSGPPEGMGGGMGGRPSGMGPTGSHRPEESASPELWFKVRLARIPDTAKEG